MHINVNSPSLDRVHTWPSCTYIHNYVHFSRATCLAIHSCMPCTSDRSETQGDHLIRHVTLPVHVINNMQYIIYKYAICTYNNLITTSIL